MVVSLEVGDTGTVLNILLPICVRCVGREELFFLVVVLLFLAQGTVGLMPALSSADIRPPISRWPKSTMGFLRGLGDCLEEALLSRRQFLFCPWSVREGTDFLRIGTEATGVR